MKQLGGVLTGIGAVLVFIALIWGRTGYYASQVPVLIGLVVVGLVLVLIGGRILRGDGTPAVPEGARVMTAPDPAVSRNAVAPAREHPDTELAADPATSAEALAELAHREPDLRPLIAANPSAYPGLLDWLAALHDPAVDAALAARGEVRAGAPERLLTRAGDPATPPAELAELAHRHPELRSAIAANPAAYDELREWIATVGAT